VVNNEINFYYGWVNSLLRYQNILDSLNISKIDGYMMNEFRKYQQNHQSWQS